MSAMTPEELELLRLAAKAVGLTNWQPHIKKYYGRSDSEGVPYWNPIRDDGDAFRLAVKRNFEVRSSATTEMSLVSRGRVDDIKPLAVEYHYDHPDACAATRLAITRAAAEDGKAMP